MYWQGWLTLFVIGGIVWALVRDLGSPDLILMAGLFTLAAAGVLTPAETFSGFSNHAVATVGALLVLSAAVRDTGALEVTFGRIFGRSRNERIGLIRMIGPMAGLSAFLNNTTIVAMMAPVVIDWCRRHRFPPARFLLPLSYATILGGVVTLIGTTTNLLVSGMMIGRGMEPMGFFELAPAGIPIAIAGLAFLALFAGRLLPERRDPAEEIGDRRREYTVAMIVEGGCPLIGQTIEQAGLRHLPGLFLVEIDRDGRIITPVGPDETIEEADCMVFAGVVETIVDLQKFPGLTPADDSERRASAAPGRRLVEAVISRSSPLVNRSIRDASFRTRYDAAVIAVHRNGERVAGKIGTIVLEPGDTLLLQSAPGFARVHRNSPDFYLVSEIAGTETPRYDRAGVAVGVLVAMIALVMLEVFPLAIAAFLAAGTLIVTGCISPAAARRSVDWPILITMGAAIGIGLAMEKTGAADAIARGMLVSVAGFGPVAALAVVYLTTLLLAETIGHAGAAAIMFPIGIATGLELGVGPRGFAMTVAIAASCGFASPFAYQTHLIIYGPGGYRFADFVRIGLPLDILCGAITLVLVPVFWPL